MFLKRNTITRLLKLRTLLCMQLLTYETMFEYIVWPIRRTMRRVHCKKNTTLHNVLTYRVMPVCKYSHTRTCLCAMCHLISICFMTTAVFPRKYLDSVMFMHKFTHTKRHVCHTFCFMEMCPSTVWHLVCHYFVWCEGTINAMFTLKTLLGCVYVQLLTYVVVSVCISLTWSPRMHTNVQLKTRLHTCVHVFLTKTYLYPFFVIWDSCLFRRTDRPLPPVASRWSRVGTRDQ